MSLTNYSSFGQLTAKSSFLLNDTSVDILPFEFQNSIKPENSFNNYFGRIHKKYPETNTKNIEILVKKILSEKDSHFLNIVRKKTQLKDTFFNRFFEEKTPFGNILQELQNSQESPNRKLLNRNIIYKANIEAKKLLDDFSKVNKDSEKIKKLNNFNLRQKRRELEAVKLNDEFQINNYTTSRQQFPSEAALNNGNFVVVWESSGQDTDNSVGIYGQIFDTDGEKIGSEFQVNTYITGSQESPSVASIANGNFIVTWHSRDQDGDGYGVFGQIFNQNGTKIGSEFQVNTYTTGNQWFNSVTGFIDGNNCIVAWNSDGQDGDASGIFGQILSPNGTKIGSEFQINTYTNSSQANPSIAANNNVIVVWVSYNQDGDRYGIFGQILDETGTKTGAEFPVNSYTFSDQLQPASAALTNGNFVITWSSMGQDGIGWGVFGQIINPDSTRNGSEFQINTHTFDDQRSSSVASLPGNFIVVWQSAGQDGASWGIFGQIFNLDNTKNGSEFQINTYTASDQKDPSVAALINGNIVVTWDSDQDADGYGIFAQIFGLRNILTSTSSTISQISSTTSSKILPRTTNLNSTDKSSSAKIVLGITIPIIVCFGGTIALYILKKRKKYEDFDIEKPTGYALSHERISTIGSDFIESRAFELEAVIKRAHKIIGDEYYQLSTIYEEEAKDIYLKKNFLISMPEGEKKLKFKIGEGNFGKIKIAQNISTGEYLVSKKIKGESKIKDSEEEANLQKEAEGDNILPIYNTVKLEEAMYHFMPLAGLGDGATIQKKLALIEDSHLVETVLTFIAKDILTGLKTIHEKRIFHLDMKPDNFLIDKDGTGYITDFGCAKKSLTSQFTITKGDVRYYSPDRLQAIKNNTFFDGEKEDIWALGVSLLQIFKNLFPLELFSQEENLLRRVVDCDHNFFYERLKMIKELQYPKEESIFWVIEKLLDPNAKTRFSASQALKAQCFENIKRLSKEKVFEDLQKQVLQKQTKEREINISDYTGISHVLKERQDLYLSKQNRQFYEGVEAIFKSDDRSEI